MPPLRLAARALVPALEETVRNLFVRHGVTTICEIAASPAGVGALEQLSQAIAAVAAFPRIGRGLHRRARTPAPDQRGADGRLGLPARFGNDRFSIQAAKIFVDGGRDGAFRSTQMTRTAEEWGILTPQPRSS